MAKQLKSTKICKFIQGKNDAELFSRIGAWCVSPEVHRRLGTAVSALPDDVWYVTNSGFLQLRLAKNGTVHIRFLFTENEKDTGGQSELITAALADYADAPIVFTNDRKESKIWKRFKFVSIEKERGEFCRWEKKNS